MTDYFALLDQPRQPWLEPEQLKQAFHTKTLSLHPDTQPKQSETGFAEINEAYQVLRDPKRRLEHLLDLEGYRPPKRSAVIPKQVEALFPAIASLMRNADVLAGKLREATHALSRSLLKAETLRLQDGLHEAHEKVSRLNADALVELKQLRAEDVAELHELYLVFSYCGRWLSELEEKRLQLALPNVSS
jgi:curved DNA-binding protein CbpA